MGKIKLSIKSKNYNGSFNKYFKSIVVDINDLEHKCKSYNYSLITWKIDEDQNDNEFNRKRKEENFESASGIVVDIDEDLSIDEAQKKLINEKLNHVIITSRNHQKDTKKKGNFSPAQDRYHILILFDSEVTDENKYRRVYRYIKRIFPQMDDSCSDLARFIFASPVDAEYRTWFDGEYFKIDKIKDDDFLYTPIAETKYLFEFDNDMLVRLGSGEVERVDNIFTKHPFHCLRSEHQDSHPSAFITFNEKKDKWMSYCSACGFTGWSKMSKEEYEQYMQMQDFYYLGKDIYEMGIAEESFF